MTPKERDELVVAVARNDSFIADQRARIRVLTAMLLRAERFQRSGDGNDVGCANLRDGIADLLRCERKGLRRARYVGRMAEGLLSGRIPSGQE
jgi:hypothetical protein